MKQEIIDLYDEYTHTGMGRRVFIEKLAVVAGGLSAASALLPFLELNYAYAATVPEDDKRLITSRGSFGDPAKNYKGYFASPKEKATKRASVIIIHENRGLNAHIEDVARRVALAGYNALAPDGLSPMGGTPKDEEKAKTMIGELKAPDSLALFLAAMAHMRKDTPKVGCVGFCWGGAMANQIAVNDAKANAAVAFYGRQPAVEDVPKIKVPLMLHYGGKDTRLNEGIPAYEVALKKNKIKYELFMYPEAQHAFHNDTAGERYNKDAAALAWERTLKFFKEHLGV